MAPSRPYIPSVAIIRALSRPFAPQSPVARRFPVQCLRGKRTKATPDPDPTRSMLKGLGVKRSTLGKDIESGKGVSITFYEQDLDRRTPERRVGQIATPEDVAEHNRRWAMHQEAERNPDYDDTELNVSIMDDMMLDPSFADLRDGLQSMKEELIQRQKLRKEMRPEIERDLAEMDAQLVMATHKTMQEMIDDPEYAEVRDDMAEFQSKLPEWHKNEKEMGAMVYRLNEKLAKIPAHQRRLAALEQEEEKLGEQSDVDGVPPWEQEMDDAELRKEIEDDNYGNGELDSLLRQMKGIMAAMDGDKALQSEMQDILDDDPTKNARDEPEQELDLNDLAQKIKDFQDTPAQPPEEGEDIEDPKLKALVDKIMADPQLLPKLAMIKEIMETRAADRTMVQPSAPDPETLDRSQLVTYRERLKIVENDPEHLAAIRRLRINLLPPFNVSPAVRTLNEALKLAYCGASDDIRRVLWRSYSKARTVPTVLQNIPDDAWDMMWYSQAVNWNSNQNRSTHLNVLLQDLSSVGKDGPPTHPDALAAQS